MNPRLLVSVYVFLIGYASGQNMCTVLPGEEGTRGQPVVFGQEVPVPALNLRFLDEASGKPISPRTVTVHYYWQWIMYPATEHVWGAWADAEDRVRCEPAGQTQISIPPFTVKPRGWYNGKYTDFPWSKKPRFDRLEVVIEFDRWAPRLIIKEGELKRYKDALAILKLPRAGRAKVVFEHLPAK
jgi:hypothetical protein